MPFGIIRQTNMVSTFAHIIFAFFALCAMTDERNDVGKCYRGVKNGQEVTVMIKIDKGHYEHKSKD